jgi:hypothetical protein
MTPSLKWLTKKLSEANYHHNSVSKLKQSTVQNLYKLWNKRYKLNIIVNRQKKS